MESLMLSGLGGIAAWGLARCGVQAYSLVAISGWKRHWFAYTTDYRVLAYLAAISIGTGLLFGLAPAIGLNRFEIGSPNKNGRRGGSFSSLLVTGEMALAVVLLAGAGVMLRSFLRIYSTDVGVHAENIVEAYLELPEARYSGTASQITFFERLSARLEALPGVASVAIASALPTGGSLKMPYEIESVPNAPPRATLSALVVGPHYFRTLGTPVLSGREFNDSDGSEGNPAVIVNHRFATTRWPPENPLGRHLRLSEGKASGAWLTVVGVVSDIVQDDRTRQEVNPIIYLPFRQRPSRSLCVMMQTRVPPGNLAIPLWRQIQALEPNLAVGGPETLAEVLKLNYREKGIDGALFLIFAAVALLLASVGLYGVMAHAVGRRTREIGIRMAVGGTTADIRSMVLQQGLAPLGAGLIVGLPASFALNRVLKSQLVQVSPSDPLTLALSAAVLLLAGVLGCLDSGAARHACRSGYRAEARIT